MLESQITKLKVIALIYDTYHIVPPDEALPLNLRTVEGVEGLVKDNAIPREIATLIYKIMTEPGDNE